MIELIIGFFAWLILSILGVYFLKIKKKSEALILFGFALLSGFAIANYNVITHIGAVGMMVSKESELKKFNVELVTMKEEALENFTTELAKQKLIVEDLLKQVETQKTALLALNSQAEATKSQIERITEISKDLTLTYTKIAYLQAMTKNNFGGEPDKIARQEITNELNRMIQLVLPNDVERSAYVYKVESILNPPKEQSTSE
ncbi:MAG TPA: hypothetical protein VJG90_07585 [Candidatus Nanoarchaeia archaeon]|nr:hypothetical protein [Candidatus Nanoarchaeia archaeon]